MGPFVKRLKQASKKSENHALQEPIATVAIHEPVSLQNFEDISMKHPAKSVYLIKNGTSVSSNQELKFEQLRSVLNKSRRRGD